MPTQQTDLQAEFNNFIVELSKFTSQHYVAPLVKMACTHIAQWVSNGMALTSNNGQMEF